MIPIIWLMQYVLGGFFAFFMSGYVLSKSSPENKTWTMKGFFVFGLLTAIWEFASFFQRTAPTPWFSSIFFYIILITSSLSQPTYLVTVLSIQKEKKSSLIFFVPALIRIITFAFLDLTFTQTEFGWTYSMSLSGVALEIGTAIYLGYFIAILAILRTYKKGKVSNS